MRQLLRSQIQEQATVQFDSIGCKGFEQKDFNQVKGISMAGSPTYTANTSLDLQHLVSNKSYQELISK